MIEKHGTAKWSGNLQEGTGFLSSQSGTLKDVPYSFAKRFEGVEGTNPEELIGAAHASCFAMALSMILAERGMVAEMLDAKSTVSLEKVDDGFAITKVHLDLVARIPDAEAAAFEDAANAAKAGCPVSKLLDAEITLDARLA